MSAAADPQLKEEERTQINAMSYEQAMAELDQIVRALEGGQVSLDESLHAYARGSALRQHCEAKLKDAELLIEKMQVGPGGDVTAAPLDQEG